MSISSKFFGKTTKGQNVTEYTLLNKQGASVRILDLGGTITGICVPDREGKLRDVELSYDDVTTYEDPDCGYAGALIGRYGNRIANACFKLDGVEYKLHANNGANSLHGGLEGFNARIWDVKTIEKESEDQLELTLISPDMDQGYPGTLKVKVTYTWDNNNALTIHYSANTDKLTICNLTNHAYFNLEGHNSGKILEHELQIFSDYVNEVHDDLIPTGKMIPSKKVCYGFVKPTKMSDVLSDLSSDHALENAGGVDFNYCAGRDNEKKCIAILYAPNSGIEMEVITDQPGVQCYTGQFLCCKGKDNTQYGAFDGMCLETQHYPDSMNNPHFPSVVLRPQDQYDTFTCYRFSVRK